MPPLPPSRLLRPRFHTADSDVDVGGVYWALGSIFSCGRCFAVSVLPVEYYRLYKVVVRLTDTNDHAPIFHQPSVVLNISESMPPGTRFSLPVADDRDSEKYAVVEYRLEPSEMRRIFSLNVVTEADGSQQVCCHVTYLLHRQLLT